MTSEEPNPSDGEPRPGLWKRFARSPFMKRFTAMLQSVDDITGMRPGLRDDRLRFDGVDTPETREEAIKRLRARRTDPPSGP